MYNRKRYDDAPRMITPFSYSNELLLAGLTFKRLKLTPGNPVRIASHNHPNCAKNAVRFRQAIAFYNTVPRFLPGSS